MKILSSQCLQYDVGTIHTDNLFTCSLGPKLHSGRGAGKDRTNSIHLCSNFAKMWSFGGNSMAKQSGWRREASIKFPLRQHEIPNPLCPANLKQRRKKYYTWRKEGKKFTYKIKICIDIKLLNPSFPASRTRNTRATQKLHHQNLPTLLFRIEMERYRLTYCLRFLILTIYDPTKFHL